MGCLDETKQHTFTRSFVRVCISFSEAINIERDYKEEEKEGAKKNTKKTLYAATLFNSICAFIQFITMEILSFLLVNLRSYWEILSSIMYMYEIANGKLY